MGLSVLAATLVGFGTAAVLSFAIPIGLFGLGVILGFAWRKPMPDPGRRSLFRLPGLPQRTYDLSLLAALHERDRAALRQQQEETQAGGERPVGGP